MNARFLCAVLLLCFGSKAYAVDFYELEGYFVSKNEGSIPRFSCRVPARVSTDGLSTMATESFVMKINFMTADMRRHSSACTWRQSSATRS